MEIDRKIDIIKLHLENQKISYEIDLLKRELQLKEKELNENFSFWHRINLTALAAIIAALIAFMGNILVEQNKHNSELIIQERKNQAALILEAAKTLDTEKTTEMLKFFIETRLINNKEVEKYIEEKGNIFKTITVWGKDGILRPGLSKSWEASDDFTSWIITIREGMILNDGRMLNSIILKEIIEKEKIPNIKAIEFVEGEYLGFKSISNLKLKIVLEKPEIHFIERLSSVKIPINKN